MPDTITLTTHNERSTDSPGSDQRQLKVQLNNLVDTVAALFAALHSTGPVNAVTPTVGTTVTVAIPAQVIQIAGVPVLLTAETAKAFGSLGTIPASKWGLITLERVAAGTTTFVSAAANYTTGYTTEAAAIAAIPAISAGKARCGYITILASSSTWVAGTDGLADGSGGNVATTTNYYSGISVYDSSIFTAGKVYRSNATAPTY